MNRFQVDCYISQEPSHISYPEIDSLETFVGKYSITRMHFSRMCTAHLLMYPRGSASGVLCLGSLHPGGLPRGGSAAGGGGLGRPPSSSGQKDLQTGVKTLPSGNFVCGCNQHQACILETNYYFSFPYMHQK